MHACMQIAVAVGLHATIAMGCKDPHTERSHPGVPGRMPPENCSHAYLLQLLACLAAPLRLSKQGHLVGRERVAARGAWQQSPPGRHDVLVMLQALCATTHGTQLRESSTGGVHLKQNTQKMTARLHQAGESNNRVATGSPAEAQGSPAASVQVNLLTAPAKPASKLAVSVCPSRQPTRCGAAKKVDAS